MIIGMDEETNRWKNFTTKELLVLSVLSRGLNSEIDRRYFEYASEALADKAERGYDVGTKKPREGQSRLVDALRQVDSSNEKASMENYATKDEVWHLRVAMRSLIAYLQGEGS